MSRSHGRRLSPAIVISIVALVVAASGTAAAAGGLVSGNKMIKKDSLSGNRLVKKSVTGTQIKSDTLKTVPKADVAGYAVTAGTASSATNAVTATNAITAGNALELNGQPSAAYEPSGDFVHSGLVTATDGQTVTLAVFGPFTLALDCQDEGTGSVQAEINTTTTAANSDIWGAVEPAGTYAGTVANSTENSTTFNENDDNLADFATAAGAYQADLVAGENFPGAAASTCFAMAFVTTS